MSTNVTIHDAQGRITLTATLSDETLEQYVADGAMLIRGVLADAATQYVLDGAIQPRPANPAILTGHVIKNIAGPSTLTINGASFEVADATVELELTDIGKYAITMESWPYLPATLEVTV